MELTLGGGLLFLAFAAAAAVRGASGAFIASAAVIPFGSSAVVILRSLSDVSVIAAHLCFAATVAVVALAVAFGRGAGRLFVASPPVALYGALLVYGALVTVVSPALFGGDIWVVSFSRDAVGQSVSALFGTQITQLDFNAGNISQTAYFLLSGLAFVVATVFGRAKGAGFLERAIVWAAAANLALGALDLLRFDALLNFFHTATYINYRGATVLGAPRVIGGMTEASFFAYIAGGFAAYFLSLAVSTNRRRDVLLGGGNGVLCLFSLSSTGLVALGAAAAVFGLYAAIRAATRGAPLGAYAVVSLGVASLIAVAALTPLGAYVAEALRILVFEKSSTVSALERGFWARAGFQVGVDTWGLGAGIGSHKGNGWLSVWFSNLGVIGVVVFLAFLASLLTPPRDRRLASDDRRRFRAARLALLTMFAANFVSGSFVDPGLLFMLFAALATTLKHPLAATAAAPIPRAQPAAWTG